MGSFMDYFTNSKSGKLKADCIEFVEYYCSRHMMFNSPSAVKENVDKSLLLLNQLNKIYKIDGRCYFIGKEFLTEVDRQSLIF